MWPHPEHTMAPHPHQVLTYYIDDLRLIDAE
jgi:hypothetical protein